MKMSASPFVVRVWMPILFMLGVYLFFRGIASEYWLIALPLVLMVVFMTTLAEIRDQGHRVHVKTLWRSIDIPKEDVAGITQSLVEGVGVLRLRRFVFPWGRIYFVSDWSKFGVVSPTPGDSGTDGEDKPYSMVRTAVESLAVAISGFLAARALRSSAPVFRVEISVLRTLGLILAMALFVLFAGTSRRRPSFANVVLFMATFVVGLVLW